MAAPTFQELYDLGLAEALIRRPTMSFFPGDVSDMALGGAAAIGDRLVGYAADRFKATYVDGARGDDLTTLADDHWGVTRIVASKAVGEVTLTRADATANAFTLIAGSILATTRDAEGQEIRIVTTEPATWGVSVNGDVTVECEAETAGPEGNAAVGEVNRIISTTQYGSYTVTNADSFAGGAPEESDAALRERVRSFPSTLRRGTLDALEYGALTVAGVGFATATETETGLVVVYVSDVDGGSNPTMAALVTAELENWRAAGTVISVTGGILLPVDIQVTLTVRSGANVAEITSAVTLAVESALQLLKIGETLYRTQVSTVVRNVSPDILEVAVLQRTGSNAYAAVDIAPTDEEVIRLGSLTVA